MHGVGDRACLLSRRLADQEVSNGALAWSLPRRAAEDSPQLLLLAVDAAGQQDHAAETDPKQNDVPKSA